MGVQSDAFFSAHGETAIMRDIQKLWDAVADLRTARRSERTAIGSEGIRVKGGFIAIFDGEGNETARFATDGLTLQGLLSVAGDIVVDGGSIAVVDPSGATVFEANADGVAMSGDLLVGGDTTLTGTLGVQGSIEVTDAGEVRWFDDLGNVRLKIAQSTEDGIDTVKLIVFDEDGNDRVTLGEVNDGGTVHEGVVVKNAAGKGMAVLTTPTATAGSGFAYASDQQALAVASDQLVIARPGVDNDAVIRVTEADGLRVAVDTDGAGVQSGQVTAGPADSAGPGFRTLRIPN